MPGVVRMGDVSAGHCFTPRPPDSWSPNVTANNKPVVRLTDHWPTHCCGIPCHDGVSVGRHNVTANGLDIQVHGDPISCGDSTNQCSNNVTVNG